MLMEKVNHPNLGVYAGFSGYACAEFEGKEITEMAGSIATISLLKKTRDILSSA